MGLKNWRSFGITILCAVAVSMLLVTAITGGGVVEHIQNLSKHCNVIPAGQSRGAGFPSEWCNGYVWTWAHTLSAENLKFVAGRLVIACGLPSCLFLCFLRSRPRVSINLCSLVAVTGYYIIMAFRHIPLLRAYVSGKWVDADLYTIAYMMIPFCLGYMLFSDDA